jgi:integrase
MPTISKRVTSKGKVHYRVQVRLKGYPVRMSTFDTKKEALDWARDVEDGLKKGRLGAGAPDRTFAELLDRFEERKLAEMPRVDHGYRGHLRWWRKELGGHFLRQVTTSMVREAKEKLLRQPGGGGRRRGRATVNRYMTTLSTVFRLGLRLEWIEHNVAHRIEKEEEPDGRVRFLSRPVDEKDCELDRLLTACRQSKSADLADLVVLALHTGCRASELLQLRAAFVRLSVGGFTLPAEISKNGEPRFVPLAGDAAEIVERRLAQLRKGSDYLFGGRDGGPLKFPRHAWEKALERACIDNFRFHDLRHTHASYLAMLGASNIELKESLGHKTLAMVARYTHLANNHKSEVAARLAGELQDWRRSEAPAASVPPRASRSSR